jgi:hypothetical protein
MAHYERIARGMGIPLSKGGRRRTKAQLKRAISYRR